MIHRYIVVTEDVSEFPTGNQQRTWHQTDAHSAEDAVTQVRVKCAHWLPPKVIVEVRPADARQSDTP